MRTLTIVLVAAALGLVGCKPNLQVSFTCDPAYDESDEIGSTIKITVSNTGNANATGTLDDPGATKSYMVDLVLSTDQNVPVAWANVPDPYVFTEDMLLKGGRLSNTKTVAGGGSAEHSAASPPFDVTGEIPDGCPDTLYLVAVVDPGNKVAESNEDDNVFYKLIVVNP